MISLQDIRSKSTLHLSTEQFKSPSGKVLDIIFNGYNIITAGEFKYFNNYDIRMIGTNTSQ